MFPSIEVGAERPSERSAWHGAVSAANRSPVLVSSLVRASLLTLALGSGLGACASTEPPPPATAAHFDAIQRQEAIQDEVRVAVIEPATECPTVCNGTQRGCEAADRICAIAESVTDADAQARCGLANDRCTRYRTAATRCDCP